MSLFSACDDAPRNRPTKVLSSSSTGTEEEVDQETIDEERIAALARPTNAVKIENDFCACQAGKPIILGNCATFCSSKTSENPILYMNVTVTEAISAREDLKTFYNWCTKEIVDPETNEIIGGQSPSCALQVKDPEGNEGQLQLATDLSSGSQSLQFNIASLDFDKTYRVKVVEVNSGAQSSTVQVRKKSEGIDDPIGGALWTNPVYQYTCMNITIAQDGQSLFYEDAARIHFYFNDETRPEPLSSEFVNIYCHDIITYGKTPRNSPLLEETPGAYTLWSTWDPRFWDTDGDSVAQINQILQQNVRDQGFTMDEAPNLFHKFQWYNGPDVASASTSGGSTTTTPELATLGYYMTPWIDKTTFKAYCPKQTHYYSNNQLFIAMRDIVGVDTEALYIAKQEGSSDYILVRESVVKEIWFYTENGQNIEPNNNTITGKQVKFYWPADPISPFVKKSHQSVYTIKRASEVGSDNISSDQQNTDGSSSNYPPHDKRIGCIPAL